HSLAMKARKYGPLARPFVVAIWPVGHVIKSVEVRALFGTEAVRVQPEPQGTGSPASGMVRLTDGIFNLIRDGGLKYRKVSGVLFYQRHLQRPDQGDEVRLYHNPYALHCLPQECFEGVPQFVPLLEPTGGFEMKWRR